MTETGVGYAEPKYLRYGDAALVVEFGDVVDDRLSARALAADAAFQEAIAEERLPGVYETSPSFRSVLLTFDPIATDADAVEAAARSALVEATEHAPASKARRWRLPVCYDPEVGLDLADVAERAGLSVDAVVERCLATQWRVYMIGFLPGCPFMGRTPAEIDLPRRKEPRIAVPARSVAIAVGLSVIYPVESPGGWNVLGRTPAKLFDVGKDPAKERPTLFAPDDVVVAAPIDLAELRRLEGPAAAGEWTPDFEPTGADR